MCNPNEKALEKTYVEGCVNRDTLLAEEVPLMVLRHCMNVNRDWISGLKKAIEAKIVFSKESKGSCDKLSLTLHSS